jgi:Flp pilus assembly protein TadD
MYLKLIVWPSPLLFHYELPYLTSFEQAWMYVLPVVVLGIVTLVLLWRNRPLGYLGTWVFAILAPTSVVPIVTEMAAERRLYLPLAAFAVLIVVAGFVLVQRRTPSGNRDSKLAGILRPPIAAAVIPALLLAVVYGVAGARHLPTYREATNLWRDVLHHQPQNSLAHLSLGLLLSTAGEWPEATEHLQTAAKLRPNDPSAFNGLGRALTNTGRLPEAIEVFRRALALNPEYALALNNLGFSLNESGRHADAIPYLEHALRLMPDLPEAHNSLGISLGSSGNTAQAVVHFRRAVQLDKDFPEPRKNLAFGLAQLGNLPLAIEQYKEAIRLKPDYWSANLGLAQTLALANRSSEAIAVAERAIGAARAAGQQADSEAIERWLRSYQNARSK